jgi:hypothetical protein
MNLMLTIVEWLLLLYCAGVLGYFQAQLTDITTYADLQPKVFQRFREVGNALIVTLMLQQALVRLFCFIPSLQLQS